MISKARGQAVNKETRQFLDAITDYALEKAQALYATGKVDLEYHWDDEKTALHLAAGWGAFTTCKWLCEVGANVDARARNAYGEDEFGHDHHATPLMCAAASLSGEAGATMRLLIASGADVNAQDFEGKTAIFYALNYAGDLYSQSYMGANLYAKTLDSVSDRLQVLIDAGVDINLKTKDGVTALMYAAPLGDREVMALLKNAGASDEGLPNLDLMAAAEAGDVAGIQAALAAGADVDFRSYRTPLSETAQNGHIEAVRTLLAAGANPNRLESDSKRGDFGPLSRAVYAGHLDIVRLLLEAGASPTARNHSFRVLDYAKMGKAEGHKRDAPWDEIIALIRHAVEQVARMPHQSREQLLRLSATLSAESNTLLAQLAPYLPETIAFKELSEQNIILLESGDLATSEAAQLWSELVKPTRALGWSCFVTHKQFDHLEPSLGTLLDDIEHSLETPLDQWMAQEREYFDNSLDDGIDDDEAPYLMRSRARSILALRESDLEAFRTHRHASPSFAEDGYKTGGVRRLVLVKGSPMLGPLFYRFGGWNDAPPRAVMAQMIDRWHQCYGAELAFIGHDTLELLVDKPLTLDQVKVAALEVPLFCNESESYRSDVSTVCNRVWFFWWD